MSRRRALLSVSDKTGLIEFATGLDRHGFELRRQADGTVTAEAGLAVTDVAGYRFSRNYGRARQDATSQNPWRTSGATRQ